MTSQWEELWPVAEPPDDFALNVLVKSVEQRSKLRRQSRWLLAALVPCLCVGLLFALGFRQHQVESQKRASILEVRRRDTEARLRQLQNDFEFANRRERELQSMLASATEEATRTKVQMELDSTHKRTASAGRAMKYRTSASPARAKSMRQCEPADSLCAQ